MYDGGNYGWIPLLMIVNTPFIETKNIKTSYSILQDTCHADMEKASSEMH